MALPWLIGGAVIATAVGYLASQDDDDDDYEECMYCSRQEYRDGLCRKHYREEEAEREEKEKNRQQIQSEIDSFKSLSKRQIRDKYGVKISFGNASMDILDAGNFLFNSFIASNSAIHNNAKVNILDDSNSKVVHFINTIEEYKKENSEIQVLISDLRKAKNEI